MNILELKEQAKKLKGKDGSFEITIFDRIDGVLTPTKKTIEGYIFEDLGLAIHQKFNWKPGDKVKYTVSHISSGLIVGSERTMIDCKVLVLRMCALLDFKLDKKDIEKKMYENQELKRKVLALSHDCYAEI